MRKEKQRKISRVYNWKRKMSWKRKYIRKKEINKEKPKNEKKMRSNLGKVRRNEWKNREVKVA